MAVNKKSKFILKLIFDVVLILIPCIVSCLTGWFKIPMLLVFIVQLIFICEFNNDIFNYITKNKYNKKEGI